jgi:uncharacterized membrane protein YdjX (TVP38/TMEM64 family)
MTNPDRPRGDARVLWLRAGLLPLAVVLLFVAGRRLGLGVEIEGLRAWIGAHGALGLGLFFLLYLITGASGLPGLPLTLAAGALFGAVLGTVVASVGSALGAAFAFFLARSLAREAVARRLGHHRVFARIDRWTRERGAVTVALTRIFPVFPYSLLNLAFGLTGVRFWTYLFWTWLCMLPGTTFYVVGADALLTGLATGTWPVKHLVAAGLVLAIILSLVPWARRRLRENGEVGEDEG